MDRPDLAWKLLLQRQLPAVLARLFPEIHALVDWERQYCLPDKSLPPLTPDSRTGQREPDFVALVTLKDGGQACLHIEIQCTRQAGFAERMALYHSRLRDRFNMPVFSLAILGDTSPTWRPDSSAELRIGYGTTFRFQTAKLLDFRGQPDEPLDEHAAIQLAITAHLLALATRRRPEARYHAKWHLLRPIYALRSKQQELRDLQMVIDWILPLPGLWQRRLIMDIETSFWDYQKYDKNSLNYLVPQLIIRKATERATAEATARGEAIGRAIGEARGRAIGEARGKAIGEARGEARGKELGKLAGQRQALALQLTVRFGVPDANVETALQRANAAQLERLAIALLDADSLQDALRAAGLRNGG